MQLYTNTDKLSLKLNGTKSYGITYGSYHHLVAPKNSFLKKRIDLTSHKATTIISLHDHRSLKPLLIKINST